ncbi:transcriptional regulator [Serratia quinivorans]|uniref:winged helix-turn-helix domain-containing protein n=2 Tax=Serratia TaxID=613 RepID=UPI0021B7F528|nr:hypothetical protein [Serratia quinivorans]
MKCSFYIKIKSDIFIPSKGVLILESGGIEVVLSNNQKKLFLCLLSDLNDKQEIIKKIWPDMDCKLANNNYAQLIYRTRKLLSKKKFPPDVIITIPRYGVCLNKRLVVEKSPRHCGSVNILNDHAVILN